MPGTTLPSNEHFVPAYQKLIEGLTPLKGTGANDKGLYYFPEGQKYYQYLVNAYTGTSYQDIPSLKKAMSSQMMDDLTAMDELLTENPLLAKKLYSYSFSLTDPNEILENLRTGSAPGTFLPLETMSATSRMYLPPWSPP